MFNRWFRKRENSKHSTKPVKRPPSPEAQAIIAAKVQELLASPYRQYLKPLKELVKGKMVVDSRAGTSGFVLYFSDSSWVVSYLKEARLSWQFGTDELVQDFTDLINSGLYT